MRSILQYLFPALFLCGTTTEAPCQVRDNTVQDMPATTGGHRYFIDHFTIPPAAVDTFKARMKHNRDFIHRLPGFIEDHAYTYTDGQGNLVCVTIARWSGEEALGKAKAAVQAEYKKQGFDPAAFLQQWGIRMERGVFREAE